MRASRDLFVTVLTPTWNAARWAREAAASVAGQTWRGEIEHLVIDAGSTDGTVERIREGNPRAIIVSETVRDGLYASLNRGFARSRGSVIAWLNADDVFLPDAIERAASALDGAPDAGLAIADLERLKESGERVVVRHPADVVERCRAGDLVDGFVTPMSCFWRREVLASLGDYDPELRIVADRDLWLRMAARSPVPRVVHTGAVTGTFREHEGSLSSGAPGVYRSLVDHARLWGRWADAPQATPAMRASARALWQTALLDVASRDLKSGRVTAGMSGLSRLVRSGRGWWKPIARAPSGFVRRRRT